MGKRSGELFHLPLSVDNLSLHSDLNNNNNDSNKTQQQQNNKPWKGCSDLINTKPNQTELTPFPPTKDPIFAAFLAIRTKLFESHAGRQSLETKSRKPGARQAPCWPRSEIAH